MDRKPQYADLPLPELLRQLSTDTATLVRQEIRLARVELTGKAKVAGRSATFFGAAAVLGFGAFLAVTACAVAALALVLQVWAAALVVTAVKNNAANMITVRERPARVYTGNLSPRN